MSAKTILQIKNLDISFRTNAGVVHAIRGINLDLQKGETVAIVGESGSGKSVTMKAAVGLLDSNATINSGEILYTYDDGHGQDKTVDLLKLSKKQLRTEYNGQRLAMVFQDPMASLNPRKKVGDIISEGMDIHHRFANRQEREEKISEMLKKVGLSPVPAPVFRRSASARRHCPRLDYEPQADYRRRVHFRAGCVDSGAGGQPDEGYSGGNAVRLLVYRT